MLKWKWARRLQMLVQESGCSNAYFYVWELNTWRYWVEGYDDYEQAEKVVRLMIEWEGEQPVAL
jgi:hypothetical protein